MVTQPEQSWVLLSYRIPREPSTPRIAIWRKLKELGVAQVGDGLVALPNDARTKEHLEWIAAQVTEANGDAIVWVANPAQRRTSGRLASEMRDARSEEYSALVAEIVSAVDAGPRTVQKWRRDLRKIDRRDYFRAPGRDEVRQAIENHVAALEREVQR
ncbi:MAG: Chromate resistance protein ChrB [Acidimicrobiales bacterium]